MPDSVIGQPIDRVDGTAKVTGAARYAADTVASRTPAVGVILTSTIGHGRIAAVDKREAERAPGMLMVMSHDNAPAQAPFQQQADDRHARPKPQLSGDQVHFHGEPVALVVAETFEQATAAARLVKVTYRPDSGAYNLQAGQHSARTPKHLVAGTADSKIGDFTGAFADGAVKIDLPNQTLTTPAGRVVHFDVDAFSKHCLVNGVDELGYILQHEPDIAAYEASHPAPIDTLA